MFKNIRDMWRMYRSYGVEEYATVLKNTDRLKEIKALTQKELKAEDVRQAETFKKLRLSLEEAVKTSNRPSRTDALTRLKNSDSYKASMKRREDSVKIFDMLKKAHSQLVNLKI